LSVPRLDGIESLPLSKVCVCFEYVSFRRGGMLVWCTAVMPRLAGAARLLAGLTPAAAAAEDSPPSTPSDAADVAASAAALCSLSTAGS